MKVLLDEDVPRRLKRELAAHDTATVVEMGWPGMKNGVLLGLAESAGFSVFVTCDRNIEHQQNVPARGLAIIVLAVPDKRWQTMLPLAAELLSLLSSNPEPGTLSAVGQWRAGRRRST